MSYKKQYQTLFAYHAATFNQLLDCAEQLPGADDAQQEAEQDSSIHNTLFHVLYWHNLWRLGIAGDNSGSGLQAGDFQDVTALRSGMAEEAAKWQQLLEHLQEDEFEQERTVIGSTFPIWRILQHLLLHGMQHHSEVAEQLTRSGHSPGGLDFIWYTG